MRIATLQLAAKLGDVEGNIRRANELLDGRIGRKTGSASYVEKLGLDVLVLPELALTGKYYLLGVNACVAKVFIFSWVW